MHPFQEEPMAVRSRAERIADTQRKLEEEHDVWLATAQGDEPYLVPFSLLWDAASTEVVLSTVADSPTVRNIEAGGRRVRLSTASTEDVLIMDGEARVTGPVGDDAATGQAFAERCGWDPRTSPGGYVFIRIRLDRAQAWRGESEIKGRTIMREGRWLE